MRRPAAVVAATAATAAAPSARAAATGAAPSTAPAARTAAGLQGLASLRVAKQAPAADEDAAFVPPPGRRGSGTPTSEAGMFTELCVNDHVQRIASHSWHCCEVAVSMHA